MAATTLPTSTPRTVPPRLRQVGSTLAKWAAKGAQMASAARHRLRRPALVIGGLGFMDAAAYQGPLWLGLLVTGVSLWVFEGISGGDE